MLRNLFRRPKPVNHARELALQGVSQRKAKVRAVCDDIRAKLGLEPARWPV